MAMVAEEGFSELNAALLEGALTESTPIGKLKRSGYAYVAFALRRPEHFAAMFDTPDSALDPACREAGEAAFATLVRLIEFCQREGQLPEGGTE